MKRSSVLTLLFFKAVLAAGPLYQITDLGSLGGSSASGYGISASGLTVGGATDVYGNLHAISAPGNAVGSIANNATAWDANAAGQIAGVQYEDGEAYATRWQNGVAQTVGSAGSYATGINEAGRVTGMTSNGHVFLTDAAGNASDLGAIGSGTWSAGYDVNNAGQVAGYGMLGFAFRAFRWTNGSFQLLNTLGGANSYAMAINDSGMTVGHAQTSSGWMHAAVWNGSTAQDLGTLGGGNSFAYDVNNSGVVVGYSTVSGVAHAFVYSNGVMLDLNTQVSSSGWLLQEAYGINDSGQIVGSGILNGQQRVFRLDPIVQSGPAILLAPADQSAAVPEPSTWILTGLGIGLCTSKQKLIRNNKDTK
jgi:probable HAF family extracellular repeat protein